ncbi:MAG TPA: hypothetical protein VII66_10795 [Gemmatimonadaceae bacterium]
MSDYSASVRPGSVTLAGRLLWISAAITAVLTVAAYAGALPFRFSGEAMISNFITAALLALCAAKIGAGRNWARWLMLIIFVLGSLTIPIALILAPQILQSIPALLLVVFLLQSAIQIVALVLAFMPTSRIWFRPPVSAAQ